jgi:hypothetical protein
MVNWPESLVLELAARRCVIFLGAGCSIPAGRYDNPDVHPPTWDGFLRLLLAECNRGDVDDQKKAAELLDFKQYLDCAEILRSTCIHAPDYNRIVTQTFERYKPTEVHRLVERVDQKIVVTTNFDTLYEGHCRQGDATHGYAVMHYYDQGLINRLRSPTRVIVKAHGCATAPERTILSKSDFFKARATSPAFFKTLESLFLTNTLVFLGYSVSDPDIQLILENSTITASSEHPHYALMPKGLHSAIRAAFRRTYNIEILEFDPGNNFAEFVECLRDLASSVEDTRGTQP